jgi:REP element-mobilizing transposase RayT
MFFILKQTGCHVHAINSVEDHIHLLFDLPRKHAVSTVVSKLKALSSRWIRSQDPSLRDFAWQGGYGIFAVSKSGVKSVERYIARQREHHQRKSFQQEYRAILSRHQIPYDERYIWG